MAIQAVLLHGVSYEYLSKLDERSIIRRECEGLERAWLLPSDKEISCRKFNKVMIGLTQYFFDELNKDEKADKRQVAQVLIEEVISGILSDNDVKNVFNNRFKDIYIATSDNDSQERFEKEMQYLFSPLCEELREAAQRSQKAI